MKSFIFINCLSICLYLLPMERQNTYKNYTNNFKDILISAPTLKFLAAYHIAFKNIIIKHNSLPKEALELINNIKLIQSCDDCLKEEKIFFLNLLNEPDIDIEKNFMKLITKYLNRRINQRFIDKYHFLNFMLSVILDDIRYANSRLRFLPIINLLLNNYIDINANIFLYTHLNYTPLTFSARIGHEDVVKILLNKKADINLVNTFGETPLICAVLNNNRTTVNMLLNLEVDINAQDKLGRTALIYSALHTPLNYHQDCPMLKALINKKADVNIKDRDGNTALMYAIKSIKNTKKIQILIASGANINDRNQNGETALMIAIKSNTYIAPYELNDWEEIFNLLVNVGADLTCINNQGETAVTLAESRNLIRRYEKLMQILKEAEAKSK